MDFSLLPLSFIVKYRFFKEERAIRKRFYQNIPFRQADQALRSFYTFNNPYRISKKFLMRKGCEQVHAYGETPLTTLETIGKVCGLTSNDYAIDMGCGRGRGVFFLSHWFGCQAKGIDWVPEFIENASATADRCNCPRISFSCQDMASSELSHASFIYLYGTCLEDPMVRTFIHQCESLKKGAKVVTVSYPLTDYPDSSFFRLKTSFSAGFPWGTADLFLHEKI